MIWLLDGFLVSGTAFLLLFGEYIAGRFFNRKENQ